MEDEFMIRFPAYVVAPLVGEGASAGHGLPIILEIEEGQPAFLLFTDSDLANRYIEQSGQVGRCRAVQLTTTKELAVLLKHAEQLRGATHVAVDLDFANRRARVYRVGDVEQRLPERWSQRTPPPGE